MAIQLHDLTFHLSGGIANNANLLSLGGAISESGIVGPQVVSQPTNITGVTIVKSVGNAIGNGVLSFINLTTSLSWADLGSTSAANIAIIGNGRYVINAISGGYIVVDVVLLSLPAIDQSDINIAIASNKNSIFDDITKLENHNGDTEYRCLFIRNENPIDTILETKLWIASQPTGADSLALMIDPAGVGDGSITGIPQVIANENTTPAAGLFSNPNGVLTGLAIGQLLPNETAAFWIKRNVPALNTLSTIGDLSSVGFRMFA